MAQITRTQQNANISIVDSLLGADGKVSKADFQKVTGDQADSAQFIGPAIEMPALNYDCSARTWQSKAVSTNSNLTVSNAKPGEFYFLEKTGTGTLTLPTGGNNFTNGQGNVVPSGNWEITFGYSGTKYSFSFRQIAII